MKIVWRMKVVQGKELEVKIQWVMEDSLVIEVGGVVGGQWDGDELVHTEVQSHVFLLHVCRCSQISE